MNSTEIFNVIEQIAATSSKKEKEALVQQHIADPDFERVLKYAYDPFKTYGIAKRPALVADGTFNEFDAGTWELLDDLISRKVTGNQAIEYVVGEMSALNSESSELFWRIISKDLRAGFSESTINKAKPKTIPDFPYMRCTLPDKSSINDFDWLDGVISQEKADGMFCNANCDGTGVWLTTRQGSPIPLDNLPYLKRSLMLALPVSTQTHGELLVVDAEGKILAREVGNGILNSIINGGVLPDGHTVIYCVWDNIPLTSVVTKGKCTERYADRLKRIAISVKRDTYGNAGLIETRIVYSKSQAMEHYREMLRKGKEGTIVSNKEGIWKDGTSKDKVKLKLEVPVELEVIGFNEGTGKNVGTLGSFQMASKCRNLRVDVSARGDAMRDEVWQNKEKYLGSIWSVKANGVISSESNDGIWSLFLPILLEQRLDKSEADTLEGIQEQFANAIK